MVFFHLPTCILQEVVHGGSRTLWSQSTLLRKSDTLRFSPCIIDNMFRNIGDTRVSLSLSCRRMSMGSGMFQKPCQSCRTNRKTTPHLCLSGNEGIKTLVSFHPRIRRKSRSCSLTLPRLLHSRENRHWSHSQPLRQKTTL